MSKETLTLNAKFLSVDNEHPCSERPMFMNFRAAIIFAICFILSTGQAHAETALDKYIKKNTVGVSGKGDAYEAGINKVFKSSEGYWTLDDSRAIGGFCAITYVTPAYFTALYGGGANPKDTFFVFNGPTIPGIKKEKRKQMTITGADGVPQTTQAIHAPDPVHKEMGTIFFRMVSIESAMDGMFDVEHVKIVMDKKQVFSIKWKGGHTARTAMKKCLASTPSAGAK